jgi:hypothetical protein
MQICRRLSAFKDLSDIRLQQVGAALADDRNVSAVAAYGRGS